MIGTSKHQSHLPPDGIVPDKATAVKIGCVFLPRIFGEEEFAKYLPYHAHLSNGVWEIYGTLKPGSRGGTPRLAIQKERRQSYPMFGTPCEQLRRSTTPSAHTLGSI